MKKYFYMAVVVLLTFSCTPKLDGDVKNFANSRKEVEKSLNGDSTKIKRLGEFIGKVQKDNGGIFNIAESLSALNGKTYDDLEKEYGAWLDQEINQQMSEINKSIEETTKKIEKIESSKGLLNKVSVSDYKVFATTGRYSWDKKVSMVMTFNNELDEGLKRIYCNYALVMKNSTDTIVSDAFNYSFDLPMKGSKTLNLSPNFTQKDKITPKRVQACDFVVSVTGFTTNNYDYSSYEEKALIRLKEKVEKLKEDSNRQTSLSLK